MHPFTLHKFRSEESRFKEHYLPLTDDMFALGYRLLQDESAAQDIVQDALAKLWQMRSSLPDEGADKAYCLTMVRNLCIDQLRRQQTLSFQPLETDDEASPYPEIASDENFYSTFEAQDYLEHVLKSLPPKVRQLVEYRLRDGFSFKEIELLTGISEGNARVILLRTLRQLREQQKPSKKDEQPTD